MVSLKTFGSPNLIAKSFDSFLKVKVVSTVVNEYEQEDSDTVKKTPALNVVYKIGSDITTKCFNLNSTNIDFLIRRGFDDLDDLIGCELDLEKVPVMLNGKTVDGIRITKVTKQEKLKD